MKPISIIVETPKNSSQKYVYNRKTRLFELKKILPEGMKFPYDFGFIPGTKGADGDPLDIVLIAEFGTFPGCAVDVNIIGALQCEQEEPGKQPYRNDRFIAVPLASMLFKHITGIHALPGELIRQLADFFKNYNLEEGKRFEVTGMLHATAAAALLKKS